MNILSDFDDWSIRNGWSFELNTVDIDPYKNPILNAYNSIGKIENYIPFLKKYSKMESDDQCTWFLLENDFKSNADLTGFTWNEFEKISLKAAINNEEKIFIEKWWKTHLPIILSVNGEYSFYAIDLCDKIGAVVYGSEPEFENTQIIANNFDEFLYKVISHKIIL